MEFKVKIDDVKNRHREYEIKGEISLQNIENLVEEMKNCLPKYDDITLNLKEITGFDTAAFQFFYSIKNSCIRDKKRLKVTCEIDNDTSKLLENCGITNLSKILSISEGEVA